MRSTIGLVVRRWRAEPMAVVLVVCTVAIAAVLMAALPMYTTAVGRSALESALAELPDGARVVELSVRVDGADAAVAAAALDDVVADAVPGGSSATLVRSDQFSMVEDGTPVVVGAVVDRAERYVVVDGATSPVPRTPAAVAAAVHVDAAAAAGWALGDVFEVARSGRTLRVELVEFVEPVDRSDELWADDPLFRDGSIESGAAVELGPLLVAVDDLAAIGTIVRVDHRTVVDADRLDPAGLDEVIASIRRAPDRAATGLESAIGDDVVVEGRGGPTDELALVADRLAAGRPVVAIVLLQVVAVALVAIGLAASIVVAGRRRDSELQRLRGASTLQLVGAAVLEATVLVVPTVVAAPFVARAGLTLLDRVGPLAGRGVGDVELGVDAFLASAAVGALAIVLVVAPAAGRPRRRSTRSRLLDDGVDLIVAAGAVFALWRLTTADRTPSRGTGLFGADPVQVIAPALGVLAGAMLALRLVRTGSLVARRASRRRRSAVTHLASANLVRRPATVGRVVTVVVLAVATGVLSGVLAASWERSQRDRADATVSADVVVAFEGGADDSADAAFRASWVRSVAGSAEVVVVDRERASLSSGERSVEVVAVGAERAAAVVRTPDTLLAGAPPPSELVASAAVGGLALAATGGGDLRVEFEVLEVDPRIDRALALVVFVRDRDGTIHRLGPVEIPPVTGPALAEFALDAATDDAGDAATGADADPGRGDPTIGLGGPLDLVGVDIEVPMAFVERSATLTSAEPPEVFDVVVSVGTVTVSDGSGEGPSEPLRLDEWQLLDPAPDSSTVRTAGLEFVQVDGRSAARIGTGVSVARRATAALSFRLGSPTSSTAPIPGVITSTVAAGLDVGVGAVLPLRLDALVVPVEVVGVVEAVPFATEAADAVLVDWSSVEDRRFSTTGRRDQPGAAAVGIAGAEGTSGEQPDAEARAVIGSIEDAAEQEVGVSGVVDRWSVGRQNADDPVALSLIGAITIAAAGAVAVALVVLALSAVAAARERRSDAAALRALGLPAATVRRAVLAEIVPAVLVGVVTGVCTAVVIGRLVLTDVTIGVDGAEAVPPPTLVVPVAPTLVVALGLTVFGAICPLLVSGLLGRVRPAEELRAGAPT